MGGELHRALTDRLVDEMQGTIGPKLESLEEAVVKSLRLSPEPGPPDKTPVNAALR